MPRPEAGRGRGWKGQTSRWAWDPLSSRVVPTRSPLRSSPRKRGPMNTGLCSWVPALAPERGPKARANAPRRSAGTTRACAYTRSRHCLFQVVIDLVEETGGGEPFLIGAHQQRKVLGHKARLDGGDRDLLQGRSEFGERGVVIELGAMGEPARPGIDRGDRIGGRLLALLVLPVVSRHGAVGGLGLDHLAVGRH